MMRLKISLFVLLLVILSFRGKATGDENPKIWYQPPNAIYQTLWQSIKSSRTNQKSIRILHIGDSHITNGFTTKPIKTQFKKCYGDSVLVEHRGINGATFLTYCTETEIERISQAEPDLLIISLGTNDSYTFKFSPEELRANITSFLSLLSERIPELPVILTSPPPNFLRTSKRVGVVKRKKRHRRYKTITSYSYNKNTVRVADVMSSIALLYGYAYIDLYSSIGSEQEAKLWLKNGWMYKDRTHYTIDGYLKHGETIATALIEMIEEPTSAPIEQ